MSHEIRTPINSMVGMTELALGTRLNQEQKDYLEMSRTASQNLLRLIDDILDFTRLGAQSPYTWTKSCLICTQFVNKHSKDFAFQAEQKKIDLYLDIDPCCAAVVGGRPLKARASPAKFIGQCLEVQ
jgi:signal transduction histidine kinase